MNGLQELDGCSSLRRQDLSELEASSGSVDPVRRPSSIDCSGGGSQCTTTPQPSVETLRPQNVHFDRAIALDYPSEQSECSPATESFSSGISSADYNNGQVGPAVVRQSLGAYEHEKSDATLVGSYHFKWQPANPPSELAQLPQKRATPVSRRLRHQLLNAYQRLFALIFTGNMAALITVIVINRDAKPFGPSLATVATATASNITAAILMRQEYVINGLYTILCWTPHWLPLRIRRTIAKFYHFGGVHSGCAVSATVWFAMHTILLTEQYVNGDFRNKATMTVTYCLVVLLILICFFAVPRFRFTSHNTFEAFHRYGGWLAVALFWVEIMLVAVAQSRGSDADSLGIVVIRTPPFWLLVVITFFIILPWARLRKVQAWPEILSGHAVRIHFNYAKIGAVLGIRIANSPLHEWHPFATIPEADGSSFSIIVSDAGDWTRKQITKPAYSYWIRGIPISGVLRMACVFKRVIVVTTGSGIGPCLSLLIAHPLPCRILWSSPDPLQIYGEGTIQAVMNSDPDAMIINTRATGRPDMVGLTYHLYKESNAEAVFIISNISLTQKVVYAMESRGIPAYGPIWDS
ncbi:MAG: hypothetical protein Q9217_007028 [Psora testacea]